VRTAGLVLAVVGAAATALTLALYAREPALVAAAVCAAWWLGLTVALGALGAVMALNLSHATWFVVFRPITSSIAAALPVLALGLLPAALVAHHVYPWAGADDGIPHEVLARIARTRPWMSPWPVYARTLVALGAWSTLALWLHAKATSSRARVASALGLPVLGVTGTVAPFDWMMRIEAGWTSTIYGLYVLVGGFYGATGLVAVLAWLALRRGVLPRDVRADHVHAHGRLMLTAVCLWGYIGFFQLMLQWIGNIPSEAQFFARRAEGSWAAVSWVLALGHFVVPFFLLLSRPLKRSPGPLAAVGVLMVAMHIVDVLWLLIPSRAPALYWSLIPPVLAVTGLGGAWALWRFSVLTPVAARDPDFVRGERYESP
jgi:hypothetical protein